MVDLKDIPGFEERYAVSKDGRVWSYPKARQKQGRFLKPGTTPDGYKYVNLRKDGRSYTQRVATLVLITYVGRPEGMEVDHINHVRDDNRLENLRWISRQENVKRIWTSGRRSMRGEKNTRAHLTEEAVLKILEDRKNTDLSYSQLAQKHNTTKANIANIIRGKNWKHLQETL